MTDFGLKDIVSFSGSSWHRVAVSLAAAIFPSVKWAFCWDWPSVGWRPFALCQVTGSSEGGHWSPRFLSFFFSSVFDTAEPISSQTVFPPQTSAHVHIINISHKDSPKALTRSFNCTLQLSEVKAAQKFLTVWSHKHTERLSLQVLHHFVYVKETPFLFLFTD